MATYGTFVDNTTLKANELNDFFKVVSSTSASSINISQGVTLSTTQINSRYWIVNKVVFWNFIFAITTSGTASNPFVLNLPVAASSDSFRAVGSARFFDASASDVKLIIPVKASTTTLQFYADDGTSLTDRFGVNPAVTAANGDSVSGTVVYEAA
jgi:hypothetical protein